MLKKIITLVAAGYALGRWVSMWQQRRDRVASSAPGATPTNTWEGEGGALQDGAQLGPTPAQS